MRRFALVAASLSLLLFTSCSSTSMLTQLASNPLVTSLGSAIGLNPTQAILGAGSALGISKEKLASADWDKVAKVVPQVGDLIGQAKSLSGLSGAFGSLSNLTSAFSKAGISADQATKIAPAVSEFVGKAAGPAVGDLVANSLK
jgi:hypothetical protein